MTADRDTDTERKTKRLHGVRGSYQVTADRDTERTTKWLHGVWRRTWEY